MTARAGSVRALRVTRGAWARAVELARDRLRAAGVEVADPDVPAVPPGRAADTADPEPELRDLGIVGDGGDLTAAWAAAIGQHLLAPVRARLRATSGPVATTTRLSLVEDRVLLVHDAVRGTPGAHELEVTQVSGHVDVVLVAVDDWWQAVRRLLPPVEQLTADAGAGAASTRSRTVLDREDAERMRSGRGAHALPPVARAVAQHEEATLVVVVEAWPPPPPPGAQDAPRVVWSRWWSVAGGTLVDVQLRDDGVELVERAPGDVALELRWALTGAIDATTPAPGGAAPGGAR